MNNPYSPPRADLIEPIGPPPLLIKIALGVVAFAIAIGILNLYLISLADEDISFFEPFSVGFSAIWIGVLVWFSRDMLNRKSNPRYTFLVLSGLALLITMINPANMYVAITGAAEAFCYLVCFILLSNGTVRLWFEK